MGALASTVQVAVIGAGAMGAGIAQVAAQAGHPVKLYDTARGLPPRQLPVLNGNSPGSWKKASCRP